MAGTGPAMTKTNEYESIMTPQAYRSCFVPHDIKAPIKGATSGPLAGLTAVVKDMYDIAGERTGCGNPEWLANHAPATRHCPPVQKILTPGRPSSARRSAMNFSTA